MIEKHERWLLVGFFMLFVGMAVPGITLGTPAVWNPDELVRRVGLALTHDDWGFFDRTNFDYPSLPKYVIYGIGRMTYALGGDSAAYVVAARLFSVFLGGGVVMLTSLIARRAGASLPARVMATLLTLFASQLIANAHWAHNDLYLLFFVTLTPYLLIRYQTTSAVHWLFLSFATIGLAASSKYNGVALLPAPLILFALNRKTHFWTDWRGTLRTCLIGLLFAAAGYALGTPRALLSPVSYFPHVWSALLDLRISAPPGLPIGLLGQWRFMKLAFGEPVFFLFVAGFTWALCAIPSGGSDVRGQANPAALRVLLVCIVTFNVPFWFSFNYQERYFLPFVPWLSVVAALGVQQLHERLRWSRALSATLAGACGLLIAHCVMRAISVDLLFVHDARAAANQYLASLPEDGGLGHGGRHLLSDDIAQWRRVGPFPDPAGRVPLPRPNLFDAGAISGETALVEQCATSYVVDSKTADSFLMPSVCHNFPVECDFIKRLRSGGSRYKLLSTFSYELPGYLPVVRVDFVNPAMSVFRLQQDSERAELCRKQAWRRRWSLETHNGSAARLEYVADEPRRIRTSILLLSGRAVWNVGLNEMSARTIAGHTYQLTFQARADAARQIVCAVGRNRPPWNAVGLYRIVDVTSDWKAFQFEFVATETESNGRIYFNLGGSTAAVELEDVLLRDTSTDRDAKHGGADR